MAVMAERARLGISLFQPGDSREVARRQPFTGRYAAGSAAAIERSRQRQREREREAKAAAQAAGRES
jgi:hypothetical protein